MTRSGVVHRDQRADLQTGHQQLVLLRTERRFVDPRYFHGTIYRAANWRYVGGTRGFRRTRAGYSGACRGAKPVIKTTGKTSTETVYG